MKRRMEQLVNGRFEYEVPPLVVTEQEVTLTLDEGKNYRGELHAGAADGRRIKGLAVSDHPRIVLAQDRFAGSACTIIYGIDTEGLHDGDRIRGTIVLSTNLEEKIIPVTVKIEQRQIRSSRGYIRTLDDFAHLASRDFREAFSVFTKDDFAMMMQRENDALRSLYQGLSRNPVTYQHLEEFLVTAGKKEPIELTLGETKKKFWKLERSTKDTIYIYKNTWGYVRMEIEVEGDFLEVDKRTVTSENFVGSVYGLEYIIRREKLAGGRRFGRIIIRSVYQTLVFEVEASAAGASVRRKNSELMRHQAALVKEYLELETHQMDYRSWYDSAWDHVRAMQAAGDNSTMLVFCQIFLYDANEENALAMELLWGMQNGKYPLDTAQEQALFLYYQKKLNLIAPEHRSIVARLAGLYRQEPENLILLLLLMREDDSYRVSLAKQLFSMEQIYQTGCTSPFLYLEAFKVLLRQEGQLRKLSGFMIQVLRFAQRYGIMTEGILKRAAYLSGHLKTFDVGVYEFLSRGYDQYPSDEVLEAICQLIMKGQPGKPEYFRWYSLAVEHELHITRLYEYYIETMGEDFDGMLPQVIRVYFTYNNALSGQKKAFVYANVIKNRDKDRTTWQSYKKAMEEFARIEVQKGKINEDYARIYREFVPMPKDNVSARALAGVLFTHRIYCENRRIRRVIVCHPALKHEMVYTVSDRTAYIRVYGGESRIFLEDEKKRRFATTIPYEDQPLLEDEVLAHACGAFDVDNPGLLLYLCGEQEADVDLCEQKLGWYLQAERSPSFTGKYRRMIRRKLLDYYWEHLGEPAVEQALQELRDEDYVPVNKASVIELLTADGKYDRAFALVEKYGYEELSDSCVLRLTSHMIMNREFQEEEGLVLLADDIFRRGLYDEVVLRYLEQYYRGSVDRMCALWEKVKGFQLDTYHLDERILTMVMFVRAWPEDGCRILESYIAQTGRELVMMAYLTYLSIGYFMEKRPVDDKIFACIESIFRRGWEMDEICALALAKYYSGLERLTEEQTEDVRRLLHRFNQEGLRFAFYRNFPQELTQMYQVDDRVFVEEKYPADSKVTIYYRLSGMEEWKCEPMRNMYQGIYVKEFLLFYGEKLEYRLVCERKGKKTESELKTIYMTQSQSDGRSRYQMLNRILAAKTIGNREETEKALRQYLEKDALVKACFSLVE